MKLLKLSLVGAMLALATMQGWALTDTSRDIKQNSEPPYGAHVVKTGFAVSFGYYGRDRGYCGPYGRGYYYHSPYYRYDYRPYYYDDWYYRRHYRHHGYYRYHDHHHRW